KRFRPRQPLNGAIVTISIYDLSHWTEEEVARYADHVRDRVHELYTRLGMRFPIYCLVTKGDLLAGFTEFFGDLDAAQRSQVWGATFEHSQAAVLPRIEHELSALEQRLYALLPDRLQGERDLQRRAAI